MKPTASEWAKIIAIGVGVAVFTAAVMLVAQRSGISPLPTPLALAFAETILGRQLPLPVGLLFHTAWVTLFSVIYFVLFRRALTIMRALSLAVALWILVLILFFPLVGWGFLGLGVSPRLIIAAAVSHLLFALFLWTLCKVAFRAHRTSTLEAHGHAAR